MVREGSKKRFPKSLWKRPMNKFNIGVRDGSGQRNDQDEDLRYRERETWKGSSFTVNTNETYKTDRDKVVLTHVPKKKDKTSTCIVIFKIVTHCVGLVSFYTSLVYLFIYLRYDTE